MTESREPALRHIPQHARLLTSSIVTHFFVRVGLSLGWTLSVSLLPDSLSLTPHGQTGRAERPATVPLPLR